MAQNRDWQHFMQVQNMYLSLGQSGIGFLKRHTEGDTHKKNMVLHKNTLNFFQPSSSKSIVIEDDDVSSSHSNTQQDFNLQQDQVNLYLTSVQHP